MHEQARATLLIRLPDALSQLRLDQGFYSTGNYYLNYSGRNEKWLKNRLGNWLYLTPAGDLTRSDGSVLIHLDPLVYDDPYLLFNA